MKVSKLKHLFWFLPFVLCSCFAFSQTTIITNADSYTWDTNPTLNYGDKRLITSSDTDNTTHNREVYLKFNLSSVSTVFSAKVVLTLESSIPTTRSYTAYLVNDSWTENTIRWNNAPAVIGTSIASGNHVGNIIEFDISTEVVSHVSNGDDTISIKIISTQEDLPSFIFSRDTAPSDSVKPKLIIDEATLSLSDEASKNNDKVSVYPNPTTNAIYIKGVANTDTTISVYNTIGQLLKHEQFNTTLDLSTFKAGIYYVKVLSALEQKTFRVIKK
ncbi:DUF7594 domain-containing protein [Kordia sp.]|uniref:CBM96 family carbohydrate-binding protein n=1 Tax=Kordia sp. TaxID=1965332 RepID=UPI003D28C0C5